jgi:hypothetical protein
VIVWKPKKKPAGPANIFAGIIPAEGEISLFLLGWDIVSIPGFGINSVILPLVSGMLRGGRGINSAPFTG